MPQLVNIIFYSERKHVYSAVNIILNMLYRYNDLQI